MREKRVGVWCVATYPVHVLPFRREVEGNDSDDEVEYKEAAEGD